MAIDAVWIDGADAADDANVTGDCCAAVDVVVVGAAFAETKMAADRARDADGGMAVIRRVAADSWMVRTAVGG